TTNCSCAYRLWYVGPWVRRPAQDFINMTTKGYIAGISMIISVAIIRIRIFRRIFSRSPKPPLRAEIGRPSQEKLESLVGSGGWGEPRYFVVCPDVGKTLPMRNYPRASYSELINILLERNPQHRVVMIGRQAERPTSEAVLAGVKKQGAFVNLCG